MKATIGKVSSKEPGYRTAASNYGVPRTTLERYLGYPKRIKLDEEFAVSLPMWRIKSVFSKKRTRIFTICEVDERKTFLLNYSRFETAGSKGVDDEDSPEELKCYHSQFSSEDYVKL